MLTAKLNIEKGDFSLRVDLNLEKKAVIGVYGPSGSGKTTLLRAIAGLEHHAKGLIKVGDATWLDSVNNIYLPAYKRQLGYVFQDGRLFDHLNVKQNLLFGARQQKLRKNIPLFDDIVAILGLAPLLKRYPIHLSGGERQRVALGRAVLSEPNVYLMDEPLASLDQKRKNEVLPFLKELMKNLTKPTFYVSHQPQELEQLADYFLNIDGQQQHSLRRNIEPLESNKQVIVNVIEYCPETKINKLHYQGNTFWHLGNDLSYKNSVLMVIDPNRFSVHSMDSENLSLNSVIGKITQYQPFYNEWVKITIYIKCFDYTFDYWIMNSVFEKLQIQINTPIKVTWSALDMADDTFL